MATLTGQGDTGLTGRGMTGVGRLLLLLLLIVAACTRGEGSATGENWTPAQLTAVNRVPIAEIKGSLDQKLEESAPAGVDAEQWRHTQRLYETYGGSPLWLTSRGLHRQRTRALVDGILAAHSDALAVSDYPLERLGSALAVLKQTRRPTAEQLAEADVMLTATYAALGEDLLTGQINPRAVAQNWHVDPREEEVDTALARGLRTNALDRALAAMRPDEPEYEALRGELERYRQIVTRGGWAPVPETRAVRPGEPIPQNVSAVLRARLIAEGITPADLPADTSALPQSKGGERAAATSGATVVYDRGLAGGVAEFQARHTIVVDSMLGPETLQAMNRPATYRLAQIAANLERYRWLPKELGSRYIFVNVPAFRLEAYDGGRKVLEMRVIVGAEYENRATPVFADSMSFVVFRPYWLIPPNIAENEIFPRGSGYLAANNMEVYRQGGETRVRQRPGPNNSLGLIKFMFPNDFAIYLHDTPNTELFERDIRAFSHGCIRVERPDQLGQFVLGWPADSVRRMMENGPDDRTVNVSSKIPVYIAYVTTFVRDGRLYFGNDLYSRDDRLIPAVAAAALPTREALQRAEALRRVAGR